MIVQEILDPAFDQRTVLRGRIRWTGGRGLPGAGSVALLGVRVQLPSGAGVGSRPRVTIVVRHSFSKKSQPRPAAPPLPAPPRRPSSSFARLAKSCVPAASDCRTRLTAWLVAGAPIPTRFPSSRSVRFVLSAASHNATSRAGSPCRSTNSPHRSPSSVFITPRPINASVGSRFNPSGPSHGPACASRGEAVILGQKKRGGGEPPRGNCGGTGIGVLRSRVACRSNSDRRTRGSPRWRP